MKTKVTVFFVLLFTYTVVAQNGINYKAVVKDNLGNVVANSSVDVLFVILKGVTQTNVYQETHTTTSDANGIIIVNIGEGSQVSGNYSAIDWGSDEHFLYVSIDIGSGWINMGTTQFKTVPYALNAANVSGLETLNEGNGLGWRLKGRDPDNYGNIGFGAIDLSFSNVNSTFLGALGSNAIAMGFETVALGDASATMGTYTIGAGINTVAMGNGSNAIGNTSTAMGNSTTSTGIGSLSMGNETNAIGNYATAMGAYTEPQAFASLAIGRYNIGNGNSISWIDSDPVFEIGNGTADNSRANAFTVLKNGNVGIGISSPIDLLHIHSATSSHVKFTRNATGSLFDDGFLVGYSGNNDNFIWSYEDNDIFFGTNNNYRMTILNTGNVGVGTTSPSAKMQIIGGTDASLANGTGSLLIGPENGANIVYDYNEIQARNNGSASTLYLQQDGGNVAVNGSIVHTSDRRLKKDIAELHYGLVDIMKLNPVAYNWKHKPIQDQKSLGLIAQELQDVINEVVYTEDDEQKTLHVNYTELIPVLIKAMQEQQGIIEQQNQKINTLTAELEQNEEIQKVFNQRLEKLEAKVISNE